MRYALCTMYDTRRRRGWSDSLFSENIISRRYRFRLPLAALPHSPPGEYDIDDYRELFTSCPTLSLMQIYSRNPNDVLRACGEGQLFASWRLTACGFTTYAWDDDPGTDVPESGDWRHHRLSRSY